MMFFSLFRRNNARLFSGDSKGNVFEWKFRTEIPEFDKKLL